MALTGALLSLWFTAQTINIFSQIGIIMLIGLITKNGILIVEFANQSKEEGHNIIESAKIAAVSRFRPILMTTLAMIFGNVTDCAVARHLIRESPITWNCGSWRTYFRRDIDTLCDPRHILLFLATSKSSHQRGRQAHRRIRTLISFHCKFPGIQLGSLPEIRKISKHYGNEYL